MTNHVLKCWPPYFEEVASGRKPFEVRKHDRPYQVGDTLELHEWSPSDGYSGRTLEQVAITYVLTGGEFGVEPGTCVLGIKLPGDPSLISRVRASEQRVKELERILHLAQVHHAIYGAYVTNSETGGEYNPALWEMAELARRDFWEALDRSGIAKPDVPPIKTEARHEVWTKFYEAITGALSQSSQEGE